MRRLARETIKGLEEALAHAQGKDVPRLEIHHLDAAKLIRRSTVTALDRKKQCGDP